MTGGSHWGVTPRRSIEAACRDRGAESVVHGCVQLLAGDDADAALVSALAGPHAVRFLEAPADQRYWLRVWGARGLLWAPWLPTAAGAVIAALDDEHWRVREMAAKVVARHGVDEALAAVVSLADDPVPRVRTAATRAVQALVGS